MNEHIHSEHDGCNTTWHGEIRAMNDSKTIQTQRSFLRDNALTLVVFILFAVSFLGQVVAGHAVYDQDALEHGGGASTLVEYLGSGHFIEAVFENWESEFLQMAIFVVLTKWLRQRGSSESKSFDKGDPSDEDPRIHVNEHGVPWPVRKGGIVLALYQRSLSISLALLFVASAALHAEGGARAHNVEERRHGRRPTTMAQYVGGSQFWFESFQNWQSEFLSVGALIVLSIFLRERGSSQSKRVAAPHAETGE